MTVSQDWVDRYLAMLGQERRPPGMAALAGLLRAHARTIPFTNVHALLRRQAYLGQPVPPVDAERLLANWELGRRGGVCFEVTALLGRLLAALGYQVHPVLGHIGFPADHQALLVRLDDGRHLVDAGVGAPFFAPIPLDGTVEVRRAGLAYRFRPSDDGEHWVQDRFIHDVWTPFCRYELHPPDERERETAYQRHHTPGESWVVDSLTLVRCDDDDVFALRNDDVTHYTRIGKRTEHILDPDHDARIARETFRLPAALIADARRARAAISAMLPRR